MNNKNKIQKTKSSNKQFMVRNLCGNKHFTNEITEKEPKKYISLANSFHEELKSDKRIRYSIFSIERGENQSLNSFHFQGYLEFDKQIDGTVFKNKHGLSDVQNRKGTQQQAIDYVKKTESKIHSEFYTFGIPKKQLHLYNVKDEDIPKSLQEQSILINQRLKQNYYQTFLDIEKDFEYIFIRNKKGLKELGDGYHPIKVLDVEPCKTIGIYGHSGIGKTTGTNNYLKKQGFIDEEISSMKASNEKRPRLWFDLKDENKKVLGIEEIRENFPEFNDLIQIIDKRTRLEVKGSLINNNFDLVIFNSLHSPEFIYRSLKFGHQVEVLRRLYKGNNSKVYELIPDPELEKYNLLIDKTENLPTVLRKHYEYQTIMSEQLTEVKEFMEGVPTKTYYDNEGTVRELTKILDTNAIPEGEKFKQKYSMMYNDFLRSNKPTNQ